MRSDYYIPKPIFLESMPYADVIPWTFAQLPDDEGLWTIWQEDGLEIYVITRFTL